MLIGKELPCAESESTVYEARLGEEHVTAKKPVQGNFTPRFIDLFNITEEREEELKPSFKVSFPIRLNLRDEIHLRR
jgi:hypothetical protein